MYINILGWVQTREAGGFTTSCSSWFQFFKPLSGEIPVWPLYESSQISNLSIYIYIIENTCDPWLKLLCVVLCELLFVTTGDNRFACFMESALVRKPQENDPPPSRGYTYFGKKNCKKIISSGALTFLWNLNNSIRIDQLWRTHKAPEARALGKWVYCQRARHQTCHQDAELKNRHPEQLSRLLRCFLFGGLRSYKLHVLLTGGFNDFDF